MYGREAIIYHYYPSIVLLMLDDSPHYRTVSTGYTTM